jgi:hypothetical protein
MAWHIYAPFLSFSFSRISPSKGIIPLLEIVSRGIPIVSSRGDKEGSKVSSVAAAIVGQHHDVFPEDYIRSQVMSLCRLCKCQLLTIPALHERVFLALTHSRSVKLKGNILSSLWCLNGLQFQVQHKGPATTLSEAGVHIFALQR